jgi:small subunit ribosomal protein S6
MRHRYEALLVLNSQGREDTIKEIIDRLESEFQQEGAQIEQVQKMDKRQFSYAAGPLSTGYYVNLIFNADPQSIAKLRSKFKLDPEVYRQNYQRLPEKKLEKRAKMVAKTK